MDWLPLLGKLLPLYGMIGLGYLGGKYLGIATQSVARLLIYLIVPVVFFGATARLAPSPSIVFLPLLVWGLAASVLGIMYLISRQIFADAHANLAAASAASVNSGYFGIPIFILLFGEEHLGIYMLAVLGYTFNELTFLYFTMARGHYSWRQSLRKLLGLPSIYAGIAGIAFAFTGWQLPAAAVDTIAQFRGAYVVIGMMMLGLALSQITRWQCDWRYLGVSFFGRFVVTALLVFGVLSLNNFMGNWLTPPMQQTLKLLCVLPMAANLVAYAAELNLHPDQAAAAVLLSTILAALLIPLAIPVLIN